MPMPRPHSRPLLGIMLSIFTLALPAMRAGTDSSPTSPDIRHIVRDIDAANIERTIRKLVSFGTRNTLSSQTDPNRGIGAARDWLLAEFQKISTESGGRLKVELQSFEQPAGPRIPKPTRLTNIIALL